MQIQRIFSLFKKELRSYFFSPFAYLIFAVFSFTMGWMFFNYLSLAREVPSSSLSSQVLRPIFGNMNFLVMIICPLITMKLFAEEKSRKTLNLLYTSPLTNLQIYIGKYLSAITFVGAVVLTTLVLPITLSLSGFSDWPVVFTSYLGLFFNILIFTSVGLFASSLTDNQFVSGLISFCILFALLILIITANATENIMVGQIFQYFSSAFHYEGFARGVVKSYNLVYYASFVLFFGKITLISLESRNW